MENLTQIECDREIKKIRRTINILIILNLCPVYAGSGHSSGVPKSFFECFDREKSFWVYLCVPVLIWSGSYGPLLRFWLYTISLARFA